MNTQRDRNQIVLLVVTAGLALGCGKDPEASDGDNTDPDPQETTIFGEDSEQRAVTLSSDGHDRLFGVKMDARNNIYVAGSISDFAQNSSDFAMVVTKLLPTGELDASFGTGGVARHNLVQGANGELARAIALLPSGRLVVAGTVEHPDATDPRDRDIVLLRLNEDGTRDDTFGDAGVVVLNLSDGEVVGEAYVADVVWGILAYDDGRLLISGAQKSPLGADSDFAIVRLNADGTRDMGFGVDGVATVDILHANATPRTALILPDGSILGSGYMGVDGVTTPVVFKLTSAGKVDASFGHGGVFNQVVWATATEIYSIALQGSKIVTVGYGHDAEEDDLDWVSLRLNSDGTLDTTYGENGAARVDFAGFNDNARTLTVLDDGRVMLFGGARTSESNTDAAVAVLTPDGALDTRFSGTGRKTFDLGGPADMMWSVTLNAARTHAVAAGVKAMGNSSTGNDDGALLTIPLGR